MRTPGRITRSMAIQMALRHVTWPHLDYLAAMGGVTELDSTIQAGFDSTIKAGFGSTTERSASGRVSHQHGRRSTATLDCWEKQSTELSQRSPHLTLPHLACCSRARGSNQRCPFWQTHCCIACTASSNMEPVGMTAYLTDQGELVQTATGASALVMELYLLWHDHHINRLWLSESCSGFLLQTSLLNQEQAGSCPCLPCPPHNTAGHLCQSIVLQDDLSSWNKCLCVHDVPASACSC